LDIGGVVVRVAAERSIDGAENASRAARVYGMKFRLQLLNGELLLYVSYAIASPTPTELAVTIDSGAIGKHIAQRY
jgi:hypothetical protein